jgi:hypothetical protein
MIAADVNYFYFIHFGWIFWIMSKKKLIIMDNYIENIELNVTHYNKLPNRIAGKIFLNCLYLNAQSLRNSLNDLQDFIDSMDFEIHVVLVVETWIKSTEKDFFNLRNYKSFHSVRQNSIGGGASIFLLDSYDTGNVLYEDSSNNNNILLLNLLTHNLNIALCYRQPNNKADLNGHMFFETIDNLLSSHNKLYFFGDVNLNLFLDSFQMQEYKTLVNSNGFTFINSLSQHFPTRVNERFGSSSCIDHIFTDMHFHKNTLNHSLFYFDNLGDHKNMILSISDKSDFKMHKPSQTFMRIDNEKILRSKLLNDISLLDFNEYVHHVYSIISQNTKKIIGKRRCKKPFMTSEILSLISIRNKYLHLKAKFPHCDTFAIRFRHYRSLVRKKISLVKKSFYDKKFQDNVNNPRVTWQYLNSLIYNKCLSKAPECTSLVINGISVSQPEFIADHLNKFFCSIGQVNINRIHVNDIEFDQLHSNEQYLINSDFTCPHVTEDEINLVINNLSSSNAVDIYGISNNFVKKHKHALVTNLTSLIDNYLFQGIFPEALKLSLVSALHKGGDKTNPSNYRPISITPIFGKIFEYILLRRLDDHLTANKIIHLNQFGSVKNSSTEITAAHILHDVYRSIDIRHEVALTCIDIQKAFDSVKHSVLISKLKKLSLPRFFLNVLISYLTDRMQAFKIGDKVSSLQHVTTGVPQGGVLSGMLFNIYINSLFNLPLRGSLYLYCDDMSLVNHEQSIIDLKLSIEHDLDLISLWLRCHFLLPNVSKTKYLLLGRMKNLDDHTVRAVNIRFNTNPIERVTSLKLLGLTIDENLSFKEHISIIQNKVISFSFALRRCRKYINDQTATSLYYAHIQSHFMYMSSIYCPIGTTLMNCLEVTQRKSLRIILRKDFLCSRSELYSMRFLPVSVICKAVSCLQLFKIMSNKLKCNFPLNTVNQRHDFPTRSRHNFIVDFSRTSLATQDFFIHGLNSFNSLPQEIKQIFSISIVKQRLKEHFFDAYCNANYQNT